MLILIRYASQCAINWNRTQKQTQQKHTVNTRVMPWWPLNPLAPIEESPSDDKDGSQSFDAEVRWDAQRQNLPAVDVAVNESPAGVGEVDLLGALNP